MKPSKKLRMFIVRKYILATSVADAVQRERNHEVDDCWIDEEWRKAHDEMGSNQKVVGFSK